MFLAIARTIQDAITDENGSFNFGRIPAGDYWIVMHTVRRACARNRGSEKGEDRIRMAYVYDFCQDIAWSIGKNAPNATDISKI